jgi:TatD DNase family protein
MIDLHCHIDLYPNPRETAEICSKRMDFALSVTTTPSAWPGTSSLAANSTTIETALGLHPQLAGNRYREIDLFEKYLPDAKWVGEIGLDGAPEFRESWPKQMSIFQQILQLCSNAGGRLLSIHSRLAVRDVLDTLKQVPPAGTPILHWFSGTLTELEQAISLGCWFSVGTPMLRTKKGQTLVHQMPRDRVLTETDGPFTQTAGAATCPWNVIEAENELRQLWGMAASDLSALLAENLKSLMSGQSVHPKPDTRTAQFSAKQRHIFPDPDVT